MSRPTTGWWRDLRRAVSWHRRLLAAGLAAASVAVGLAVLQPAPPPTADVITASRDLDAGTTLVSGDVTIRAFPAAAVPAGALPPTPAAVVGRSVAGPVRAGEVITDVRLVGPALVARLAGDLVAAPVRMADASAAALVRPGDRVDVLATPVSPDAASRSTRVIAADVVVVAVPASVAGGIADGALLVLATTPPEAELLANAAVTDRLSFTLRG